MNDSNNMFFNNGNDVQPEQTNSNPNNVPLEQVNYNPNEDLTNIALQSDNNQDVMQPQQAYDNQSINNSYYATPDSMSQNYAYDDGLNDEELLRLFIGNNYDKITTRHFNFAGFFFTSFYMFYRKMFLYGIILFIFNLVLSSFIKNSIIISLVIGLLVGFFINKIYLYYAMKKINKIKFKNSQKSVEEIKSICIAKGGTSIGRIFLGFFAEIGILIILLFVMLIMGIGSLLGEFFDLDNWEIKVVENGNNKSTDEESNNSSSSTGTLLENVSINGYSCIGSTCDVTIEDKNGNETDYAIGSSSGDLLTDLGDYSDYIKVDIYYTTNGNKKTISSYKIYLKSNNEDISSVKTENELRDKIGLYSSGTHTDTFTLKEIGTPGFVYDEDDSSYSYNTYVFVNSKNIEYEMKYESSSNTSNLVEGNKYTVTFEVVEGTFDYEFNIKSIS